MLTADCEAGCGAVSSGDLVPSDELVLADEVGLGYGLEAGDGSGSFGVAFERIGGTPTGLLVADGGNTGVSQLGILWTLLLDVTVGRAS
jgi:hypothetical protein